MNSLSPEFVTVTLAMLVVYFVFGIVFFAYVPMDAISNSVTRTCSNASGGKWVSKKSKQCTGKSKRV